jgi:hypothetical protein
MAAKAGNVSSLWAYLQDFLTFLWAVITNWAGYATGGVIVALVALYTLVKEVPIPKKVGIAIALFFLLLAIFTAWRNEYLKTRPGLIVTVRQIGAMTDGEYSRLFVITSVSNRGSASVADGWELRVKRAGSKTWGSWTAPYLFEPNRPIIIEQRGVVRKYSPNDALYLKAGDKPIENGGRVTGFLAFRVPAITQQQAMQDGVEYELRCEDVSGNKIVGKFSTTGGGKDLQYFQGLEPPTKEDLAGPK